eukprot:COSAG01_NODE_36418_length_518_cov_0.732697_1_plen_24_part_01
MGDLEGWPVRLERRPEPYGRVLVT